MRIRNGFTGIVFLITIFAMLFRIIVVSIPLSYQFIKQSFSEPVFDALAAYPYMDTADASEEIATDSSSLALRIYTGFNELKNIITTYMSSDSSHFTDLVIGKRLADRIMGLDMTVSSSAGENDQNVVTVWQDDYLCYVVPDVDNTFLIKNIVDFGKQMKKEDRDFLFFMVSSKHAQTIAYPDYSLELQLQLLQELREQELDTVDAIEALTERQLDVKTLFFKTDHHWLPSTGIRADQILCEFMNENYGYCIDTSIFDPENYDTTILKDGFLGSQGKKVTTVYCKKEDFPVVIPKYDTDLEVFISKNNELHTGSIQDTLFDYEELEAGISDIYGNYAYMFYGYGDQALITVHNNSIHDGSRVLIIKTSYADVMIPYLSAVIEDLYVLDIRYFNGSLRRFINETDPNTVIIVAGGTMLEGFDFSDVIED